VNSLQIKLIVNYLITLVCLNAFEGYMSNGISMAIMRTLRKIQNIMTSIRHNNDKSGTFDLYEDETTIISTFI